MYKIMKTLYDTGFDGVIRPDHGRMIWDEVAMPGYGLYLTIPALIMSLLFHL